MPVSSPASANLPDLDLLGRWLPRGLKVLEITGDKADPRLSTLETDDLHTIAGQPALLEQLSPAATPSFSPAAFGAVYLHGILKTLSEHALYETAVFLERITKESGTWIVRLDPDDARSALAYVTLFERMGFRLAVPQTMKEAASARDLVFLRNAESERSNRRFHHILERDNKQATYKLALLRALCSLSRAMPRAVTFQGDQALVPLGLVAEYWIRDYWQLSKEGRMPKQNRQVCSLGFERELATAMTHYRHQYTVFQDALTTGGWSTDDGQIVRSLIRKTTHIMKTGPMTFIKDEDASPVFTFLPAAGSHRFIDRRTMIESQGFIAFPAELWLELNRIAPWFEDSIVMEWARLTVHFEALRQQTTTEPGPAYTFGDVIARLMPPCDARDTTYARKLYLQEADRTGLTSVWSNKRIDAGSLDVDHMLPWSRFRNNDLWNLMPADRLENIRKSDDIPSADALHAARHRILQNWTLLKANAEARFLSEARIAFTAPGLTPQHWEAPLFDALLETADWAARQTQAPCWSPL